MSHSSVWSLASHVQVPFAGHPLGGLARDEGLSGSGAEGVLRDAAADLGSRLLAGGNLLDEEDDAADGFDFHLGVYARF